MKLFVVIARNPLLYFNLNDIIGGHSGFRNDFNSGEIIFQQIIPLLSLRSSMLCCADEEKRG